MYNPADLETRVHVEQVSKSKMVTKCFNQSIQVKFAPSTYFQKYQSDIRESIKTKEFCEHRTEA